MPDTEKTSEGALPEGQLVEAATVEGSEAGKDLSKTPAPKATGNDKLDILNHNLSTAPGTADQTYRGRSGLEVAVRNVSGTMIATATFEVEFYDEDGSLVDRVIHREVALEPERSRGVWIPYAPYDYERVKSYAVKVVRTTTADVEKVQLRRNIIRTNEIGDEVITGIVKNISSVKTDTAVIATFYDTNEENLGSRVLVLKDIEPNSIREYTLSFRPQEGDRIGTYKIEVGEMAA